jgi:LuxR family quorum-sensing system transcriptional regulator CciR
MNIFNIFISVSPKIKEIILEFLEINSQKLLKESLVHGAEQMGFKYVALVQHGSLPRIMNKNSIITNCPADIIDAYIANHQYIFDPIYDTAERLNRPFSWDEISDLLPLTEKQAALLNQGRIHDFSYGVTVPLHILGQPASSCSFMSPHPVAVTPDFLGTLYVIALVAFRAMLLLDRSDQNPTKPKLTRRESECTALVALGKTDRESSQILGIAQATVKHHVNQAKRRYGVYKRAHLVALFLTDAQASSTTTPN